MIPKHLEDALLENEAAIATGRPCKVCGQPVTFAELQTDEVMFYAYGESAHASCYHEAQKSRWLKVSMRTQVIEVPSVYNLILMDCFELMHQHLPLHILHHPDVEDYPFYINSDHAPSPAEIVTLTSLASMTLGRWSGHYDDIDNRAHLIVEPDPSYTPRYTEFKGVTMVWKGKNDSIWMPGIFRVDQAQDRLEPNQQRRV